MNDLNHVKPVWVIESCFILNFCEGSITFLQVVQVVGNQLISVSFMEFVGMLLFRRLRTFAEVFIGATFV